MVYVWCVVQEVSAKQPGEGEMVPVTISQGCLFILYVYIFEPGLPLLAMPLGHVFSFTHTHY